MTAGHSQPDHDDGSRHGSVGDLSQSRITTAERHLWHIMRRSDGSRTGLGNICRVLGRRRGGKSRRCQRRRGPV